jgi:intein-encoded DNA endonuclease-like protein
MKTEIEQRVIDYYITDILSGQKIASTLQINVKTVFAILKRNNIKSRTLSESAMKYTCQDDFFNVINTEKKAYWLGVLFADGSITKKASKSGQIIFSSKDKEWVELFLLDVKSSNSPNCEYQKVYKKYIWKAQITSAQMYNDLNSLGCTPTKTKTIRMPIINDKLIHHFIRGYFDGDGTVGVYKNLKNSDWKILKSGFCSGSQEFIIDLLKILPVKNKTIKQSNECYITQHSLNDTLSLFEYMYKDYITCLERKRQVFINYLDTYKPRKRFNDYNRPS